MRGPYGQLSAVDEPVLKTEIPGRLPRPNRPVLFVMYAVSMNVPSAFSSHATIWRLSVGVKSTSTVTHTPCGRSARAGIGSAQIATGSHHRINIACEFVTPTA